MLFYQIEIITLPNLLFGEISRNFCLKEHFFILRFRRIKNELDSSSECSFTD